MPSRRIVGLKSGMSKAVRKMVRQICKTKDNLDDINPDEVINEVYKRGLISGFMDNIEKYGVKAKDLQSDIFGLSKKKSLRLQHEDIVEGSQFDDDSSAEEDVIDKTLRKSGKYYLKVEVKGGSSFLDHILEPNGEPIPTHTMAPEEPEALSKLKLFIFFKSQRFTSKSVEALRDPDFREVFLIEIDRFSGETHIREKLLSVEEPLLILILREDINSQPSLGGSLIAHCVYDWRTLLMTQSGAQSFPLELMGIGPQHSVCVGILQLRCSLIPLPQDKLPESLYLDKLNDSKATAEDRDRSFISEANLWWREYVEIRNEHQLRLIRLFAYDEKMTARPVMTFLKRFVLDDLLLTPFQASWFVSLLRLNEESDCTCLSSQDKHDVDDKIGIGIDIGGLKDKRRSSILPGIQNGIGGCLLSERWQNVETTIVSKSGTVEDHSVLLASLLLTFGLDVYVALGTKKGKGSWAWAISMCENQVPTFWESTTGAYYEHYSYPEGVHGNDRLPTGVLRKLAKNKLYGFLTVSCLFNDKGLYANIQPSTSVDYINWDLGNPSKWKFLNMPNYDPQPYPMRLMGSVLNWEFVSHKMEFMLRNFVSCARKERGLGTRWDDHFEQFMVQHLVREEMELSTGATEVKDFFRTVALKSLKPGYDFRAKSFHSNSINTPDLFQGAMSEPIMMGIILGRGDDLRHSLKVKIFPYPEDVVSVRFIIACKYIPTG